MAKDRIKELKRVPAGELIPNAKNWRTHPTGQVNAMQGILAEVGWADAVLARETPDGLELIDGHLRKQVALDDMIPVLVLDVDEAEADKILATHDPLAAMAESNAVNLEALLHEVKTGSESLQQMLTDLAEDVGIESMKQTPEIIEDKAPEPLVDPVTKPGDLILLGDHRLLCGDSTNADDVARLMDGQTADMCFTSPPYNAGNSNTGAYQSGTANRTDFKRMYIHNRDAMASDEYKAFLLTVLDRIAENVSESACVMWNVSYNANSRKEYGEIAFGHSELCVQETIVWDKNVGMNVCGKNVYSRSAELVFLLSKTSKYKSNQNGGVFWNIWRIPTRDGDNMQNGHGASFPVKLPAQGISQHSDKGDIVYEPFMGSGTTIIASEQLGRKCYGMEIDATYCDVIVQRWENLTGKKASRE